MVKPKDKYYYFSIFIAVSALSFLLGLTAFTLVRETSWLYNSFSDSFFDIHRMISQNKSHFNVGIILKDFVFEIKYVLCIFIMGFTRYRNTLVPSVLAYKGFVSGIGCSLFFRIVLQKAPDFKTLIFGGIVFCIINALTVLCLCLFASYDMIYSKKIILPIKFSNLIKRRDTRTILTEICAYIGVLLIVSVIKSLNLMHLFL